MSCPRCEWEMKYDAALQWRDWLTCDLLLEERPEECGHPKPYQNDDQDVELGVDLIPGHFYDGEE